MLRPPVIPPYPGPSGAQLLRQIPQIQDNPLHYLGQAHRQYGDFVQFPVGGLMVYAINHPDIIQHVLQDNARNYTKDTIQFNQLATVTGKGLLTSDGEVWLSHRRLMQPAFHRQRLQKIADTVIQSTQTMLAGWQSRPDPRAPIDIDGAMMELTLEIVGQTLFSIDLSQSAHELTHAVLTALDHIVYKASNFLALPDWMPTPRNLRFRQALGQIDTLIAKLIRQRNAQPEQPDDLLGLLIEAARHDQAGVWGEKHIRDEIMTLLIAGHETVASALTWTWILLGKHPLIARRAKEEVQQILGDRLPTAEDIPNLPYINAIFNESLRLYPPAWLITRKAIASDQLGAYNIPAGSLIIISPYNVHRLPCSWPNPEGFDPERFLTTRPSAHRFAYIPFGGGPRLCIGDRFAQLEATLILATILQKSSLTLEPAQSIMPVPLVTIRPSQPVWMTPKF